MQVRDGVAVHASNQYGGGGGLGGGDVAATSSHQPHWDWAVHSPQELKEPQKSVHVYAVTRTPRLVCSIGIFTKLTELLASSQLPSRKVCSQDDASVVVKVSCQLINGIGPSTIPSVQHEPHRQKKEPSPVSSLQSPSGSRSSRLICSEGSSIWMTCTWPLDSPREVRSIANTPPGLVLGASSVRTR